MPVTSLTVLLLSFSFLPPAINDNLANGQIAFSVVDGEPYVKVGADAPRPFLGSVIQVSKKVSINAGFSASIFDTVRYKGRTYCSETKETKNISNSFTGNLTEELYASAVNYTTTSAAAYITIRFLKTGTYNIKFNAYQGTSYDGDIEIAKNQEIKFGGWYNSSLTITPVNVT